MSIDSEAEISTTHVDSRTLGAICDQSWNLTVSAVLRILLMSTPSVDVFMPAGPTVAVNWPLRIFMLYVDVVGREDLPFSMPR